MQPIIGKGGGWKSRGFDRGWKNNGSHQIIITLDLQASKVFGTISNLQYDQCI